MTITVLTLLKANVIGQDSQIAQSCHVQCVLFTNLTQ